MPSHSPRILLTGLLAVGTALAQQPQRPNLTPPQPAGATVPAGQDGAGDPDAPKRYTEPKLSGEHLAEIYTTLTGRRVAISNEALTAEFHFVQKDPLGKEEALELLKVAALVEGFVFVPAGDKTDRLVYSKAAANIRSIGLPVITRASDLPAGDQVVTYVMSLKNIKPDDAKRTFEAVMMQQNSSYGSIAPVPNASAVIITDNTALIRTLIEIQQKIDVPSANIGTQFIKVQYADVTELADTLNQLVGSQQQQTQTSAGINRAQPQGNNPPGFVAPVGGEGSAAGESVPIQIVPNPRTNEIFVMGRPADIIFVEGLVRGFDSQTDQKNFLRRKLKFLAVADFLPVAQQALERTFSSGANGQGSGANFGGQGGQGNRNGQAGGAAGGSRTGQGQASTRSSTSGTSSTGTSGSSSSGSSSSGSSGSSGGLNAPDVSTAPVAQLVGRTLLVGDNITNSIVIQGPPASLEVVNKLLDEIDVKAQQVMISCVFGQLSLTDDKSFGVDYLRTLDVNGKNSIAGRGGAGTGGVIPLDPNTTTPFNPGSLAATTGLGLYGKIGPYLNIYLSAMQKSDKFTVLSRPTIYMSNNQKGSITSGTKIAVPTGSYNGGASSGISTNFEYRDVDLKLEVIPLVNSPTEITLQIYLVSQDLGNNRTVGEFAIPDILNRELLTTVTVPNNETIVLGGLITSHDDRSKNGIPILSQIPYIGGLFGTNGVTKSRDELLIFIQPKIVSDDATLYEAQADMAGRYKVDELGHEFIQGPAGQPTKNVVVPVVDPKAAAKGATTTTTVLPESQGGPRRVTSRPAHR
ncbi:MAG: hypothetical protein JWO82_601 [Akkermansiaceae bacterium]|nr:hypothetical protein [Akkermansiaceae bacterium]